MKQILGKPGRLRLSPKTIGLIFLLPGVIVGIPSLIAGTFIGATMGFCLFAVTFGAIMLFVPLPESR